MDPWMQMVPDCYKPRLYVLLLSTVAVFVDSPFAVIVWPSLATCLIS
jgi:hypothetical protein